MIRDNTGRFPRLAQCFRRGARFRALRPGFAGRVESAAMPPRFGVLLAVLFWGVSFVATKAVVAEIRPAALIFARAGLGTGLLVILLALGGRAIVPPRDAWRGLLVLGFVGVAFHQMLQAIALESTSAIHTGWLIGLAPIWSALFAAVRLRERLGSGKLGGLLLGFSGAALVVTRGRLHGLMALPSTRGDLLILASTVNWAFYSSLGHPLLRRLGPRQFTAGAMFFGTLLLAPVVAATGAWRDYAALSAMGWVALLFLGLGCSGLGYFFWYNALERIELTRVAAFLYLEPLVTLAAAVALLGEPVGLLTLAGGVLLLAGVAVVQRA
jgi:drug/metabolite transporter (DMT)-like permease